MGNLAGKTNAQVAQLYKNLNSNGTANNTYVQAVAVALGIYADTSSLGGADIQANGMAQKYGFAVTAVGGAGATAGDGTSGPAFGTLNGTSLTVGQVLAVINANYNPQTQTLYGGDSVALGMANNVLSQINAAGNVTLLAVGSGLTASNESLLGPTATLSRGLIWVSIDGLNPTIGGQQEAVIDAAIASLNAQLGPFGTTMIDVTSNPLEAPLADITVHLADTTSIGGVDQGVLGVTLLGGEVTLVNGWNWYYGADPAQISPAQYDFQTVTTHELGHALGLGHSTDADSVMFPYLAPGQVRRTLTASDLSIIDADLNGAPEPLLAAPSREGLVSAEPAAELVDLRQTAPVSGPGAETVAVLASPTTTAAAQATYAAPTLAPLSGPANLSSPAAGGAVALPAPQSGYATFDVSAERTDAVAAGTADGPVGYFNSAGSGAPSAGTAALDTLFMSFGCEDRSDDATAWPDVLRGQTGVSSPLPASDVNFTSADVEAALPDAAPADREGATSPVAALLFAAGAVGSGALGAERKRRAVPFGRPRAAR
jgi:hypothetical protein